MRILVVGSGGREHALAWKLSQEAEVWCAPGNPGIAEDVHVLPILAADAPGLIGACAEHGIDLVVVGPEDPLINGLADQLRAEGIAVFGPSAAAAQLEGSKAFSKRLMRDARVRTAKFESFTSLEAASPFIESLAAAGRGVVIKADGNALGKGVFVCDDLASGLAAAQELLDGSLGAAGATIVVEERLSGPEFSLLTMVSSANNFFSLPVAQDYKRAFDGDQGPNTGGMGSYSPVPWVSDKLVKSAEVELVSPILAAMEANGTPFSGLLFTGILVQDGIPYCLEYNVRFGDPETQSTMLRLGAGFAEALMACALGQRITPPTILENSAVTVVVASQGYPESPVKGFPITLPTSSEAKVFHAGTGFNDGHLVTAGGRVFGVTGSGSVVDEARTKAYTTAEDIAFTGAWYRTDIAL